MLVIEKVNFTFLWVQFSPIPFKHRSYNFLVLPANFRTSAGQKLCIWFTQRNSKTNSGSWISNLPSLLLDDEVYSELQKQNAMKSDPVLWKLWTFYCQVKIGKSSWVPDTKGIPIDLSSVCIVNFSTPTVSHSTSIPPHRDLALSRNLTAFTVRMAFRIYSQSCLYHFVLTVVSFKTD